VTFENLVLITETLKGYWLWLSKVRNCQCEKIGRAIYEGRGEWRSVWH
jgi:hypothetical protein